jgi:hypothetical protein
MKQSNDTSEDAVEVIKESKEFYLKPTNELFSNQPSWIVPQRIWLAYLKWRGGRQKIPKRIKDKKLRLMKYHPEDLNE